MNSIIGRIIETNLDEVFNLTGLFAGYTDDTQGYRVGEDQIGVYLSTWSYSSSVGAHIERRHYLKPLEMKIVSDLIGGRTK